jgi:hypothetical protein
LKKKKYSRHYFFKSKIAIYLSSGLIKGRPSYRRKSENPALTKMKMFLWVIFAILDPDPDLNPDPVPDPATPLNPDPI